MIIGVDYYPEQCDRTLWEHDIITMAQTGVKVVRLGEFSWSRLEPREGDYDFEWLDEIMKLCASAGLGIIMGIPTNCPPLWLYESYPDIVRIGEDGKPVQTGVRGHRCINSPVFIQHARRITTQIVRRYNANRSIVAWQIDNELEAYPCTCPACRDKFRAWLLDKYADVEMINKAFGNVVWSGEYNNASQIQPPTAYPKAWQNPALCLEWYRFCNDSIINYVKEIAITIRRECPKAVLTTNTCFSSNTPDFYRLFGELDFVSYDNYPPIRMPEDKQQPYSHAFYLDLMRGVREQKFWVMEQLSGPTGSWSPMSPAPQPGQLKGYSLQAFAHGADAVIHFRWRTALTGAEMFWHGIFDHSGKPNRRFTEFSDLCRIAGRLGMLEHTEIVSDIALLYSPESSYALDIQPQTAGFSYMEQLRRFHYAFSKYGANIDIVYPGTDLSKYKLVVAPSLFVNKRAVTENLYRFVINGGTLVLTCRTGVKDEHNNCIMDDLPTVFKELVGAEISEYDPIGDIKRTMRDFSGSEYPCLEWCDILQPTSARAYSEYTDGFYTGCPAVTMNRYCSGVTYYVGTISTQEFYDGFASNLMTQTKIPKLKGLPQGVEVTTRTNGKEEFIFFFNNSEETAEISLPKSMYSLISATGKDHLVLAPFETDIVRK
ncbi:MAG: beta-galactosidase [Ruminococcus sp.]|nr:beta-galactosidase [Ruminococcus sp.]